MDTSARRRFLMMAIRLFSATLVSLAWMSVIGVATAAEPRASRLRVPPEPPTAVGTGTVGGASGASSSAAGTASGDAASTTNGSTTARAANGAHQATRRRVLLDGNHVEERWHGNPAKHSSGSLPTWPANLVSDGASYQAVLVGADPHLGPSTTVVDVLIVPIRLVFPNGVVLDASTDIVESGGTSVENILRSPIFKPYPFKVAGIPVGNTQFGDAFMRANLWDKLPRDKDYHVLLRPRVAPVQTINVTYDAWWELFDDDGTTVETVEHRFFVEQSAAIIASLNISPGTLSIFVASKTYFVQLTGDGNYDYAFPGSHPSTRPAGPADLASANTFIELAYWPNSAYLPGVGTLAHEVLEWMNDPYDDNLIRPFRLLQTPQADSDWCNQGNVEVADPLEYLDPFFGQVTVPGLPYRLVDGVFLDWFTRSRRPGTPANQYSFFGYTTSASRPCNGDTPVQYSWFDAPNDAWSVATGINDREDVVGYFYDRTHSPHWRGFVSSRGRTVPVDFPGSTQMYLVGINDAGTLLGTYYDSAGVAHAFTKSGSVLTALDVPGAVNTYAGGINRWGDVAGTFDEPGSGRERGFVYRNGRFTKIDAPFGTQTDVLGINDYGHLTGISYDAGSPTSVGFLRNDAGYSRIAFPGATHDTIPWGLDNADHVHGTFVTDELFETDGFVTVDDGSYVRLLSAPVYGANNRGVLAGYSSYSFRAYTAHLVGPPH
jgi:hypothetical protein